MDGKDCSKVYWEFERERKQEDSETQNTSIKFYIYIFHLPCKISFLYFVINWIHCIEIKFWSVYLFIALDFAYNYGFFKGFNSNNNKN